MFLRMNPEARYPKPSRYDPLQKFLRKPEGYLPVVEVTAAVLKTGFRGWFSMEVFDSGPDGEGKVYELKDFAENTMKSHRWLLEQAAGAQTGS